MKKIFILGVLSTMLTIPASAVKKCVMLDSSVEALSYTSSTASGTWSATYSNYTISGIAKCSTTSCKANVGLKSASISDSNGKYCWCKITSPAGTHWVGIEDTNDDYSECKGDCATECAKVFTLDYPELRSILNSTISN